MRRCWSRRAASRIALLTAIIFGVSAAVPPGALPADDLPVSWLWSWVAQPPAFSSARAFVGLPVQQQGQPAGPGHHVAAERTRAAGGAGRPPAAAPGTLQPYQPHEPKVARTTTGDAEPGFDQKTSKRLAARSTARTDVYANADGSFTRRTYPRPVNYRAADGSWQPIEPDLVRRTDGRLHMKANALKVSVASRGKAGKPKPAAPHNPASTGAARGGAAPQPVAPDATPGTSASPTTKSGAVASPTASPATGPERATAPERATEREPATERATEDDQGRAATPTGPAADLATLTLPTGESVGYRLNGAAPVEPTITGATATYRNILPQTDLELETFDAGLKETLVLRSPEAASSWVFPLRMSGLTPRLTPQGSVELLNGDGKVVVWLPRGWMEDSRVDPESGAPTQSSAVRYELITTGGAPALKVVADEKWLRDPARVYPVRVDPTALTGTTGDVYVDNDRDTADHNGDNLPVGTYNSGTVKARSFIHFDEFDEDQLLGKRITAATLKLYMTWAYSCTVHRPFSVHRVSSAWTVANLTTGAHPGPDVSAAIGSLTVTNTKPACDNRDANRSVGSWVNVPLNVATFNDWSTGGVNEGLALTASESDSNGWKRFTSANHGGGVYKPMLEFTYVNNVAPQLNVRYPANNAVTPTLTPELLVRGHDPDTWPAKGLTYNFVVRDAGTNAVVANSGWIAPTAWTVPAGKLAWNKTYLYTVQVNDKAGNSPVYPAYAFTTSVPQPEVTANLAQNSGKGYDASVGNYTTSATDATVASVGPSLAVTRSYNSLDTRRQNAFGTGWSSVLDVRATQVADVNASVQSVRITYPTGQEVAFGRSANGGFTAPSGRFATLVETHSGTAVTGYMLTDKDATVYTFAQPGGTGVYRLTSVTDANRRTLTVIYDPAGNAVRLTGASGRNLALKWATPSGSSRPHVTEVSTDPVVPGDAATADTWQYTYGPDDRLVKVCPPAAGTSCWTYGYGTSSQYANAVLNVGPSSYWRLNEPAGAAIAGSGVLTNAGVDNARFANVTLGQPAALPGSTATTAGFNGTSSHVQLPGNLIADGQYQSVSMWFKTSAANGVLFSYSADPVSKGSAPGNYVPALYIGADGKLRGQFWTGAAGPITTDVAVTDGAWHHVTLAGAGDTQTLYLDGVAKGTKPGTIAKLDVNGAANVHVGAGFMGGTWPGHARTGAIPAPAVHFAGSISDVAFFNQGLTGATVAALRQAGTAAHPVLNKVTRPTGGVTADVTYDTSTGKVATVTDENGGTWTMGAPAVAGSSDVYAASVLGAKPSDYWRLGEVDVTDAVNEVQGGTATYSSVTLGADGPFGDARAAQFNGSSSYLQLPPTDVPKTGPASIEMWFKVPAGNTAGGVLYGYQVAPSGDLMSAAGHVPALYVGIDGKVRGTLWSPSGSAPIDGPKVNDGKWHHVVLSAGTNSQSLYLDGVRAGTKTGAVVDFGAQHAQVGTGRWDGSWPAKTASPTGYFPGAIAEVAYFPEQLSDAQVATHFLASKQTAPVAVTMVAGVAKAIAMPVSTVTVTGPAGEKLSYSYDLVNGNRMVAQADALGNVTKYGYDVGGYSSLVYDPRGVYTQNLQDVRGNTRQTITCQDQANKKCSSVYYTYFPDATTTSLSPDARNDLLLTIRDGRSASATDNTYLTSHAYDTKGNRISVTDPLGRVTSTTYTDGTTVPAYDTGFAPPGLPTTMTTPGGARQTVRYYANGDLAEVVDPAGKTVRLAYDGLGRKLTETELSSAFPNGLVTSYTYDRLGRVLTETEPAVTNRVTGAVHTERTTTVYDADGNVLQEKVEDLTGGDAARVETHAYNANGQETTNTGADGAVTRYEYDRYGRVVKEIEPDGGVTRNAYDAEGNLLTSTVEGFTGDPADPQPARDLVVTSKAYDPAGRLASETDAMGWTTTFTYTDNGLPAKVVRSDGTSSFVIEESSHDAAGNVVQEVSNNGATTVSYSYDAAGRQTSSTADPAGLKRTTTVDYDRDDNVVSTQRTGADGTNLGRSETMYNAAGEVVAETTYTSNSLTPVDRWQLKDGTGTRAADSAGNNHATLGAGASWSTERGGAVALDGRGALEASGPALDTTRSYTVSAWVKLREAARNVTAVAQDAGRTSGFFLQYHKALNRWALNVPSADADNWNGNHATSTSVPQLDTWTHLTGVYDAAAGTLGIYVNGVAEGTAPLAAPLRSVGALTIGRGRFAGQPVDLWPGAISDVQTYQKALSAAEIAQVHGGTAPAASAQVIRSTYRVDEDGNVTAATDPNGNTTYVAHDEAGNAVKTTAPAATAETVASGAVKANAVAWTGYNTFGEVTDNKDANGNWSVTSYDAAGRVSAERMPSYTAPGSTTAVTPQVRNAYDDSGRVASVTDPLGKVTSYEYDQLDRLTAVKTANGGLTRYRYDLVGDLLSVTDPNGAVATSTYDYLGRQLTATDVVRQSGSNHTTSYKYGFGGWVSEVRSPSGVTTSSTYNALGEALTVRDGANNATTYSYDGAGRTVRTTLPDGSYTSTAYDLADRALKTTEHDAAGAELRTESASYDAAGNTVASTDAKGTTTTFEYDATGSLVRERQPISASDVIETTFGYDLEGNRTRFTDGRGNAFWTTYNPWNMPESQIEPATSAHPAPADRTFTVAYDQAGRAVKQFLPGGVSLTSRYDEMGQLVEQSGAGAEVDTAPRVFGYDLGGRLTALSGTGGTNKLDYDDRDLPLSVTGPSGDSWFGYNPDGQLASRKDAAGTTSYNYDGAGRLATLENTTAGVRNGYTYNQLSQVSRITYGTDGNSRNFGFDKLHRPVLDELKTPGGASVAKIEYGWDANDNIVSKKTTGFTGAAANTYTYDLADRLTSWNNGSAVTAYAYDKSGNRVQNGDKLLTYDQRNRLVAADGGGYTYTPRGTLAAAGGRKTETDAFGQVVSQDGATGRQTYTYDGLGRAIRPGFSYTGLGNDLAADGTATYVRGTAGEVVGGVAGGTQRLFWTDLHTDVVGQFTATGTELTASTAYDPLGKVLSTVGMLGKLGYQSEWTDALTNRVNMHARWYNVETGQFDSRDTASNSPVPDSINANRYQYGDGNPLTVTDPTGHWGNPFKSLAKAASRAWSNTTSYVSSAYRSASSYVSSSYSYASSYVRTQASRAYTAVKKTVKSAGKKIKKAYHSVKKTVTKKYNQVKNYVKKKVKKAANYVKKKIKQGKKFIAQKYHKAKQAIKKKINQVKQAGKKLVAKTVRAVKKTASVVRDAASATKKWVNENKDTLLEVAAIGGAILAGIACTAVTAGVGAVACMVGAGALINLAKDAAQGDIQSVGDALGSMGTGALTGLVGGAGGAIAGRIGAAVAGKVGSGIGGRLATEAVENGAEDIIGQAATTGRVDVRGALVGMVPGLSLMNRKRGGGASAGSGGMPRANAGISVGGGGGGCPTPAGRRHSFDPGTRVLMADGSKRPIEDVNVGDRVAATDPGTGRTTAKPVTRLHRNIDRDLTDVTVLRARWSTAGGAASRGAALKSAKKAVAPGRAKGALAVLHTTAHHPFWDETADRWVDAAKLRVGHELRTYDGETVWVLAVRNWTKAKEMRDLTVADIHTYYVVAGKSPVLVHNNNGPYSCDLAAADAAGGHGVERHVGKDDDYLRGRNKENASTFTSLDAANAETAHNLNSNVDKIQRFLARPGQQTTSVRSPMMNPANARVLNKTSGEVPGRLVVTDLVKRPDLPQGFNIHTSYVEP